MEDEEKHMRAAAIERSIGRRFAAGSKPMSNVLNSPPLRPGRVPLACSPHRNAMLFPGPVYGTRMTSVGNVCAGQKNARPLSFPHHFHPCIAFATAPNGPDSAHKRAQSSLRSPYRLTAH